MWTCLWRRETTISLFADPLYWSMTIRLGQRFLLGLSSNSDAVKNKEAGAAVYKLKLKFSLQEMIKY